MPITPSPWPSGRHEIEIERSRLVELRSRLPEAAGPLGGVLPKLVALSVAEAAFTSFTYSLALAYNEVEAFTIAEVRERAEDTVRVQDGMDASIATWRAAEDAATVSAA
ncbi:hypothetical protein FAF44_36105 [Nonomuraea sp. MG754425]|uniref:hypothetical protein n=1 Tax=Nonomuraea sp. MG754425 TaxID=2570319 RepID=UPI001F3ECD62|nr:hypothetical protein [Nonomuraea sp. MG754425]MCF6473771.1 hypothetical protein [Nonomuraea sp. MG754425]